MKTMLKAKVSMPKPKKMPKMPHLKPSDPVSSANYAARSEKAPSKKK